MCPHFGGKELGLHPAKCDLYRRLPPCQVACWSIQLFCHNTPTSQIGQDRQTDRRDRTDKQQSDTTRRSVLQTVAKNQKRLPWQRPCTPLDPHLTHDSCGISISSAVFAQMTAECRYTLQWDAAFHPENCPFQWRDLDQHLILGSLVHPSLDPNDISIGLTVFSGLTRVRDRQRGRPTTLLGR